MKNKWQKALSLLMAGCMAVSAFSLTAVSASAAETEQAAQTAAEPLVLQAGKTTKIGGEDFDSEELEYTFCPDRDGEYLIDSEKFLGSITVNDSNGNTLDSGDSSFQMHFNAKAGESYSVLINVQEFYSNSAVTVYRIEEVGENNEFTVDSEAKLYRWNVNFSGVAEVNSDADCKLQIIQNWDFDERSNPASVSNDGVDYYYILGQKNGEGTAACRVGRKAEFVPLAVNETRRFIFDGIHDAEIYTFRPDRDIDAVIETACANGDDDNYSGVGLILYENDLGYYNHSGADSINAELIAGNTYYIFAKSSSSFDITIRDNSELNCNEVKYVEFKDGNEAVFTYNAAQDGETALCSSAGMFSNTADVTLSVTDPTGRQIAAVTRKLGDGDSNDIFLLFNAQAGTKYTVKIALDINYDEDYYDGEDRYTLFLSPVKDFEPGMDYEVRGAQFFRRTVSDDCVGNFTFDSHEFFVCFNRDAEQVSFPRMVKKGETYYFVVHSGSFRFDEITDFLQIGDVRDAESGRAFLFKPEADVTVTYRLSQLPEEAFCLGGVLLITPDNRNEYVSAIRRNSPNGYSMTFRAEAGSTYFLSADVYTENPGVYCATLEKSPEFVVESGALVVYTGKGGVVNVPPYYKEADKRDPDDPDAPVSKDDPDALAVTEIVYTAFEGNQSLVEVNLPETINRIYFRSFSSCVNLEKVKLPSGLSAIDPWTFYGDSKLNHVTIPENVLTIGDSAFAYCDSLSDITLPEKLREIGENAFIGCGALNEITIPRNVTSIGEYALGYADTAWEWDSEKEGERFVCIKNANFVIKGYRGTAAESYANENGFTFVALDDGPRKMGDVSGDGNIDVSDATLVQMIAAETIVPSDEQRAAADVNKDGSVDVTDATLIQMYAAEVIKEF